MKILNHLNILIFAFAMLLVSMLFCNTRKTPHVTLMPPIEGAELKFRGFVTTDEDPEEADLVSQIYNFSRKVIRQDTLDGHPVFVYVSNKKQIPFYTDENGTVWQFTEDDVGMRVVSYGLSYKEPVILSYWQIMLKVDEGIGTEWSVAIDTTFDAIGLSGEVQRIRYVHNIKARYEGWTEAFIPESYKKEQVLDAHEYEIRTYFLNTATGDTLFSSQGEGHRYFDPTMGAVKYITDFTKTEIGEEPKPLRGTWELMEKTIPAG